VRITLDTNLVLIREDNFDSIRRPDKKWHRPDMDDENYSFNKLTPSDIVRFPYAVLEVKLNLEAGKREPAWVRGLMDSHLVSHLVSFSEQTRE
jgi:SPX domain protein involved in polyphosphate accumulation